MGGHAQRWSIEMMLANGLHERRLRSLVAAVFSESDFLTYLEIVITVLGDAVSVKIDLAAV